MRQILRGDDDFAVLVAILHCGNLAALESAVAGEEMSFRGGYKVFCDRRDGYARTGRHRSLKPDRPIGALSVLAFAGWSAVRACDVSLE